MITLDDKNSEADDLSQLGPGSSSLLESLVIVAHHRGVRFTERQLRRENRLSDGSVTPQTVVRLAQIAGLRATLTKLHSADLHKIQDRLPAIVLLRNGSAMILLRAERPPGSGTSILVLQDPGGQEDAPLVLDEERFANAWTGEVILVRRKYPLRDENQPFGLRWMLGQFLNDRKIVRDITVSSLVLAFVALAPILFLRLLLDRVMYYGAWSTFAALVIVYLGCLGYETFFGYFRRQLVAFLVERVDAKLTTYVFDKLLNLPIDYFERTQAGEVLRDVHEVHKVRTFMTTYLFGTALDCMVLIIFLPLMFIFSTVLTAMVLGLCGLICIWIIAMLPSVRHRVVEVVAAETAKGSFLVETLHGMRAVKSLGLDARQRHRWKALVSSATQRHFNRELTSNLMQTVVTPLNGLMTNGVFAFAVFITMYQHQAAYVGALVAFMMLTGRVALPLLTGAQMIVQLDEALTAVQLLSTLSRRPAEKAQGANALRDRIVGQVQFNNVTFRYWGTNAPAIDRVSFPIPEGTTFGIVGRSGSGKTTVTRLLQLLHSDYTGRITIDGHELREFELHHLRSNIGIVLQENFLFSGPIRETIACAKPDASFEEVVKAARLAGAEEFIDKLPAGYETHVQEGSTNLSGGQRQRLAIARALITNPRILILDEATSALDAESEAIVNSNLRRIAEGRTLIIISHRLSSLVEADAILVLERGKVYDIGTHEELLDRCDIYAGLWHQQNRHLLSRQSHEIIPFRPTPAI